MAHVNISLTIFDLTGYRAHVWVALWTTFNECAELFQNRPFDHRRGNGGPLWAWAVETITINAASLALDLLSKLEPGPCRCYPQTNKHQFSWL